MRDWLSRLKSLTCEQTQNGESIVRMTASEALINAPEFTVSELSSALKRTVEDAYGHVRVRGEISGFRGPHSSGHCYFALKDDSAKIEAVMGAVALVFAPFLVALAFASPLHASVAAIGIMVAAAASTDPQIAPDPVDQSWAESIVLTTADRARDLKPQPAYLAGYGQRLHFEVAGRIGSLADYMEGGRSSAKLTWERSGFGPKDVDVAQIYDGFSASVIYGLESYGFCGEGEALDFIQDGRIELDGELPLNTFGGSLGTGRIHGLWHIIEGALQASGRAGSRQVKDANVSFVGASAPIVTGTTFIFVREPY